MGTACPAYRPLGLQSDLLKIIMMMKQGGLGGVDNFEKMLITKKEWGELTCRPGFETYCLYQSPFFY